MDVPTPQIMLRAALRRFRTFAYSHPASFIVITLVLVVAAAGTAAYAYVEREDIPAEALRLVEQVGLERTAGVADIGAGTGRLTLALWRELRSRGASPTMWATELDSMRLTQLRRAVADAGAKIEVRAGATTSTALDESCCDAIILRTVYHHVGDPAAMNASIRRSLKPNGRLVVIEFAPIGPLRWMHVEGSAKERRGHGVAPDILRRELADAGFTLIKELDDWHPMLYAMVFERTDGMTSPKPH